MVGLTKIQVKKNERAVLTRNGDFERILPPGRHWLWSGIDTLSAERFDLAQTLFAHPLADYLLAKEPTVVDAEFVPVVLSDTQVALRFENGSLVDLIGPGARLLFWKGLVDVRVDVVDVAAEPQIHPALMLKLAHLRAARGPSAVAGVLQVAVPQQHVAVVRIDGKVTGLLQPGLHGFWNFRGNVAVELVDLRLQVLEVTGQEILTRDKVSLRLNLSAAWHFADAAAVLTAFTKLAKPAEHVYRELQFGLRAAVGTRDLDALLENKHVIDDVVRAHISERLGPLGLVLDSVGVKDIILPGEMKTILAEVVQAEKTAQANLIRRREETAATRSLLNTAKVMEDNPVALRLKELETLERVAERIDKISVFGGLDQVLNGLVKLR